MYFWLIPIIILLLVIAFFALSHYGFKRAIARGRELNIYDRTSLKGTSWDQFYEPIMEGIRWIHEQEAEEIWQTSYDGLHLHARLLKHPEAEGTVIMFHGYRTNADVDFSAAAHIYYGCKNNLLLIDQRACGKSEGDYIGFGVLERHDAKLWADYVADRFGLQHRIILSGLSMGASTVLMALSLPLPKSVCGIVADSAFSSPRDIILNVIKSSFHINGKLLIAGIDFWARKKAGYALDEMSTITAVTGNTIPILFAHGTKDSRVPLDMTLQAADRTAGETILLITEGGEHGLSYLLDHERYVPALKDLCSRKVSRCIV